MARDPEEYLRALEWQLAQLTSRVHHLEQALGAEAAALEAKPEPDRPAAEVADTPRPARSAPPPLDSAPEFQRPIANDYARDAEDFGRPSPTLESRIGGQWLNRLGIVAVLVGLSYFLKLAIENNWIGPAARVLIGLAAGVGLLLWSERFRKRNFAAFAYSLKAIGIGAMYLSLWAGFQFYHLIPALVAFAGMVLVTLTSAALSLAQDSELLAGFALVGGFLTPVLISTNENQEVSLLAYLLLLDLGTFWMVSVKGWKRLLPGAFVGTALLFAGWAATYYAEGELVTTVLFASLFFLLFGATPLVGRGEASETKSQREMTAALLAVNAAVYFAALFAMMEAHHRNPLAWMTAAVAAFYFGLSRAVSRSRLSAVASLEPLHVVLAIAFLTACIPLGFDGRWITFIWDIEAAILLMIAVRIGRQLLRFAGAGVLGVAIARLVLVDSGNETTLLFNPRFGLYLLSIGVTAFLAHLLLRQEDNSSRQLAGAAVVAVNVLALFALSLEVGDYFRPELRSAVQGQQWLAVQSINVVKGFTYSALWLLYGTALMIVGFWKREAFLRWQAIVLLAVTAIKVFFFDIATLQRGYRIAAFIALGVILLAVSFFYQRMRVGAEETPTSR